MAESIREKVTAEVEAALDKAVRKGKPAKHAYSDVDRHFHGKEQATLIVRGQPRTLTFGAVYNHALDLAAFLSGLVDELVAADEKSAPK